MYKIFRKFCFYSCSSEKDDTGKNDWILGYNADNRCKIRCADLNFAFSSRISRFEVESIFAKKVGQPSFEIYQYTMSNMKDKVIDSWSLFA